ncbi:MAG: helix-turn-helix domain-containing protein [Methanobrevibacter sp.]|jgi:putative transposase|nr:helix-turn-helix domain-containing protein [Candidatus Methanoflexus mossambicus]
MSVGRKFNIEENLDIEELNSIIKDSEISKKIGIRAVFIKMLMQGSTIINACETLGISRQTGYRWLKLYNEFGYEGLIPKFAGGRPGKLNEEQKEELKNILSDENSNYTIKEVVKLVKDKYDVELSYNRIWTLVRKDFNLNYSKPFPYVYKQDKNRKKVFKKN